MAEILMRVKKKKMTITIQEGSNVFSRKIMKKKSVRKINGVKIKWRRQREEKETEQNGREKEIKIVITNRKGNFPGKRMKENTGGR